MDKQIRAIINLLALDVKEKLPNDIKNNYYKKMFYSDVNIIMELDKELLDKNISFEVAFIHVITYIFIVTLEDSEKNYHSLLRKLDVDKMFSWYKIDEQFSSENLKMFDFKEYSNIYSFINLHDTLIDKDIKKKFGQFYTPITIVKKMIDEIKTNIRALTVEDKLADPACGTGVFLVETLNILSAKFSLEEKLQYASNNMYAYDVNPFAIVATKLNLIYALISQDIDRATTVMKLISDSKEVFVNIQWRNTIVEEDINEYAIILGNPPYFKLKNLLIKDLVRYKEISYGQPNIYSFFMFWAIEHLKKDGAMCFIVPQSIRSGLYFKNLRAKFSNLRIRTMIHIDSRQNVFDRVDQAVLIICLENKSVSNTKTKIQFYDSNGAISTKLKVSRSRLMMDESFNNIFIISKNMEMYDILEKVYENNTSLDSDDKENKFCNGLFVWNQHKDDIVEREGNAIPIIYGGNIQPLQFNFNQCSSNEERKQFSKLSTKTQQLVLNGKRLLVQRTTNFAHKIRIKSCLISDEFLSQYERYFLENHINFLCFKDNKSIILDEENLFYYLGLLNSKLLNYIFISKSGNTQVSANELNSLPFSTRNSKQIAQFVKEHVYDMSEHQNELDSLVCQAYGLSEIETNFIIRW